MPQVSGQEAVKRDLLAFALGVIAMGVLVYPMAQRQAEWEAKTLACWPTKDDPQPKRHP